jgi:hypothetical protein
MDHGYQISGWKGNGKRKSVHHDAPTFKFRFINFLSELVVVSYVLSCAEPGVSMRNGA